MTPKRQSSCWDLPAFIWQPGVGIEARALERIRAHGCKPKKPMGEAWLMSDDRCLYHNLMGDLAGVRQLDLGEALETIASGTAAFGHEDSWGEWYHYLLGALLPRCHDYYLNSPLLESLITAFMTLYPNGLREAPYPEFHQDALQSLGRCMMEAQGWQNGEIVKGQLLHRHRDRFGLWGWWNASGDFSASLFFCLKYLPSQFIKEWFSSVLAIDSPYWRAQLIVWLVGAHGILTGEVRWLRELEGCSEPTSLCWSGSYLLSNKLALADPGSESFIPQASREALLACLEEWMTAEIYLSWLDSLATVPELEEILSIYPLFEKHYLSDRI